VSEQVVAMAQQTLGQRIGGSAHCASPREITGMAKLKGRGREEGRKGGEEFEFGGIGAMFLYLPTQPPGIVSAIFIDSPFVGCWPSKTVAWGVLYHKLFCSLCWVLDGEGDIVLV